MAKQVMKFLQCWISRYIEGHHRHPENIDHTVAECISDATLKGMTRAELEAAAGGSLAEYLLAKIKEEEGK